MASKYFWMGIATILLLAVVVFLIFYWSPQRNSELLPRNPGPLPKEIQNPETVQKTQVKPEEDFNGSVVHYSGGKFYPARLTLTTNPEGDGCLLRIFNDSSSILTIRLSPHSAQDARGFLYAPIAPRSQEVIDPRYHIADVAFHNHAKPSEEFSIHLTESCL